MSLRGEGAFMGRTIAVMLFALGLASQGLAGRAPLVIPDVPRDEVICFCLYTTHDRVLKMTAQLYPLKDGEPAEVALEIERDGKWDRAAAAKVNADGWMATFRVENW